MNYIYIYAYILTKTHTNIHFETVNLQLLEKGLKSHPITVYVKEDQACPLESHFLQQSMFLCVLLIEYTILT